VGWSPGSAGPIGLVSSLWRTRLSAMVRFQRFLSLSAPYALDMRLRVPWVPARVSRLSRSDLPI
jgi:hypothetical protein